MEYELTACRIFTIHGLVICQRQNFGMKAALILTFGTFPFLLAACHGPSRPFAGITPVRVNVDGAIYDVRRRGALGEAIRRNPQYAPRLGRLAQTARAAIELATGCRVIRVEGDAAVVIGRLDCADGPAPRAPSRPVRAECHLSSIMPGVAIGTNAYSDVEVICEPL